MMWLILVACTTTEELAIPCEVDAQCPSGWWCDYDPASATDYCEQSPVPAHADLQLVGVSASSYGPFEGTVADLDDWRGDAWFQLVNTGERASYLRTIDWVLPECLGGTRTIEWNEYNIEPGDAVTNSLSVYPDKGACSETLFVEATVSNDFDSWAFTFEVHTTAAP